MNTNHIVELARHVADIAATDGGEVTSVQMGAMADGSGRSFALVETYSAGLEQTYRVSSPAPPDAPAWASVHLDWTVEVRTGAESWMTLEYAS